MKEKPLKNRKHKVLILGAGAGGISLAARLSKKLPQNSVAIVDPSEDHFYQPLWTLVGAGLARKETTLKSQKSAIPKGVSWIKASASRLDPKENLVELSDGSKLEYETLAVATGLRLAWEKISGIEALGTNGICSIYDYNQVNYAKDLITNFKGGKAIFTMPPVPIKCAGAPQKIMYLAEDLWRKAGIRDRAEIGFTTAGKSMFGVAIFNGALTRIVHERGIHPFYQHRLLEVDGKNKTARFAVTLESETKEVWKDFDLLHVVPPMEAHAVIQSSELAVPAGDQKGWLEVDKYTLQHSRFKNVFGIGDVTGVPNSKTGAAVRKQAPVVTANILSYLSQKPLTAGYDGYSSCPLTTEVGKVMLAEFGYEGKLMPSFPLNPVIPRRSMWHLKKNLLPILYWHGMLKGRA